MKRSATALLCAAACALLTPAWALADDDDDDNGETTVTCGQVITESIKLANDLYNCPGIGLEVGNDDITIDLNGHLIDGVFVPADGIDNTAAGLDPVAYPDVTIKNGTIREFLGGGIELGSGADRNRIDRVAVNFNSSGIQAGGVDRLRITNSAASRNSTGFRLNAGVTNAVVQRNTATRNSADGIGLNQNTNTRIVHNTVTGNGDGIDISSSAATRVERNTITANTNGIDLYGLSAGTLLRRNKSTNNANDGIQVGSSPTGTRIEQNDTNVNGGDGIRVGATDAATVIKRNRARDNRDFGIEAALGVTDGGGNRASGNDGGGAGLQCTANISCSP